jgi:hypothetical protein
LNVIPALLPERAYAVTVGAGHAVSDGKAQICGNFQGLVFSVNGTRDDGGTRLGEIAAQFFVAG